MCGLFSRPRARGRVGVQCVAGRAGKKDKRVFERVFEGFSKGFRMSVGECDVCACRGWRGVCEVWACVGV